MSAVVPVPRPLPQFSLLPTELLLKIFHGLGAREFFSLSLTCRAFFPLANEQLRFLENSDVGALPALAKHGKYSLVKKLLRKPGVDIECRTGFMYEFTPGHHDKPGNSYPEENDGATALHWAAAGGHLNIVKLLLKKGANPRVSGNRLVRKPQGSELLVVRRAFDYDDSYADEFEDGDDSEERDVSEDRKHIPYQRAAEKLVAWGCTPLLAAACGGHKDIVVTLLGYPYNIDVDEIGGMNTADIGIPNFTGDGCTALMCAAAGGHLELVELLVDSYVAHVHEWSGDRRKIDHMQAIHFAARGGHVKAAKVLIRHGANLITRANSEGECFFNFTPLHYAVKLNHVALAKELLKFGADMYLGSNEEDGSALDMARKLGREEILKLFRDQNQTRPLTGHEEQLIRMNGFRRDCGRPPITMEEIRGIDWNSGR